MKTQVNLKLLEMKLLVNFNKSATYDSEDNVVIDSFVTKDYVCTNAPDFVISKVISDTTMFTRRNLFEMKKTNDSRKSMNLKKPFIQLVKPLFVEVKKDTGKKKKSKKKKNICTLIVDSNYFIAFMTLLTVFALLSNDLQTAYLPPDVDFSFDMLQAILLFFFTSEIIMTCIGKTGYIGSFFFWLDLIATLSLIQDISFIFNPILGINAR